MVWLTFDNVTGLYSVPSFDNDSGKFLFQSFSNRAGFVVELLELEGKRCSSPIQLPAENLWPTGVLAVLFLLALIFVFIGIAILSDIFVGAIEVITSQKRQVLTFEPEHQEMVVRDVLIWNETVANLTLLALGSSAPEILLATIEQVSSLSLDQNVEDDLGTFTIVGSAAFNFLIITAVCIVSVPNGKVSAISEYGVFLTTASWSIFAYFWLIIVLQWWSAGFVTIQEAFLTLAFFPLLVGHAWAQSRGWFIDRAAKPKVRIVGVNIPRQGDTRAVALEDVEESANAYRRESRRSASSLVGPQMLSSVAVDFPDSSDDGCTGKTDLACESETMLSSGNNQRPSSPSHSFKEAMLSSRVVTMPSATTLPLSQTDCPNQSSSSAANSKPHAHLILVTQPSNPGTIDEEMELREVGSSPTTHADSAPHTGDGSTPEPPLSPQQQEMALKAARLMSWKVPPSKSVSSTRIANRAVSMQGMKSPSFDHTSQCSVELEEHMPNARAKFRHSAMRSLVGNSRGTSTRSRRTSTVAHNTGGGVDRLAVAVRTAQRWHSLIKQRPSQSEESDTSTHVSFQHTSHDVIKSMGIIYATIELSRPVPAPNDHANDGQLAIKGDKGHNSTANSGTATTARSELAIPATGSNHQAPLPEVSQSVVINWETRDGTARAGKAYYKDGGRVVFGPGEDKKRVSISIATDDNYEEDEEFYVVLTSADGALIVDPSVCKIKIVDDDEPGMFSFDCPHYFVADGASEVVCTIRREYGTDGDVSVRYQTFDGTGHSSREGESPADYTAQDGSILFGSRETSKQLRIPVNSESVGQQKNFVIALKSVSKGALLGDQSAAVCMLGDDEDPIITRVAKFITPEDEEEISWTSQFETAVILEREVDENGKPIPLSPFVIFLHFLSVPWKVLFALVPPRHMGNGWPCFLASLAFIGGLTAFVEQLASLLGCVIDLKTSVTGITLIALGTSVPDTFASRAAALQDKHADNAIGNVTGSNSVNVFLGLGVPWVIASCYHTSKGSVYQVSNKNLPFSVTIYLVCAIAGWGILTFRRWKYGGELGGPTVAKWLSAAVLILLWFLYILLNSLKAYNHIAGF